MYDNDLMFQQRKRFPDYTKGDVGKTKKKKTKRLLYSSNNTDVEVLYEW